MRFIADYWWLWGTLFVVTKTLFWWLVVASVLNPGTFKKQNMSPSSTAALVLVFIAIVWVFGILFGIAVALNALSYLAESVV